MSTLALCMIVKDEEYFLEECLSCAKPFVDEIVVLDTGSTDSTVEIAKRYADVVEHFDWVDDFSAARNASLELVNAEWILVLDADERIDPDGYAMIREVMKNPDKDGYVLFHHNYSHDSGGHRFPADPSNEFTKGYSWYTKVPLVRLFRNRPEFRFRSPIHEEIGYSLAPGRQATLELAIHHYMHGNPHRPRAQRVLRYLEMMDKELEHNPTGRLYGIAGASAMYTAVDYDKAINYLLRAAEYGYQPEKSLEAAGEASYLAGKHVQAKRIFEHVYGMGHRSASMCLNMANLAVRSGEIDRAVELLEEALSIGGLGEEKEQIVRNNIEVLSKNDNAANSETSA